MSGFAPLPRRARLNCRASFIDRGALANASGAPSELISASSKNSTRTAFLFGSVLKPARGVSNGRFSQENVGRGVNRGTKPGAFEFSGLIPLNGVYGSVVMFSL